VYHHVQARTPGRIVWPGLYLVHLNTIGIQRCVGGECFRPSGCTLKKGSGAPHLRLHRWRLLCLCYQHLPRLHHHLMHQPLFQHLPR
jgi:hypothetical protein